MPEAPLAEPRGHRAIGVVDETETLHPLGIEGGETPPETSP
ncbi:hypothetical protein [Halopiger djelfimassiliensis]|nr:hypothetical protein [Halopiger djelfimassiliensis]